MADNPPTAPATEWVAASVRVTAFAAGGSWVERPNPWQDLALDEPVSYTKTKGEITEQGPALEHWLVVQSSPSRLDFHCAPSPDSESVAFLDVGPAQEAVRRLMAFVSPWFRDRCPAVNRVAVGLTARFPVATREEGYRRLSTFLPFSLDPDGSSDFLYQINRPRTSRTSPNVQINRLTKWSVAKVAQVFAALQVGDEPAAKIHADRSEHWGQAVVDVNTKPEPELSFSPDDVMKLLAECADLALEILDKGDK